MRTLSFLSVGILFGVILYKSEAASWFRIFEMFQFDSFHMYGIIGSALVLGVLIVQWIKRSGMKSFYGDPISIADKEKSVIRYILGGILFGLGWALAGACPGPMFVLAGAGYVPILVVIVAAILGTWIYGFLKEYLPH